jgi:hypothetical protein
LTAYENVINGDDWTIEDIRTIVNGVRGFTNLSRLKGSAVKKGEVTDNSKGTIGSGDDAITITKGEYDQIMSKQKSEQASEMAKLLRSRANDNATKRNYSKEEAEKMVKEIMGDRPNDAKSQKA